MNCRVDQFSSHACKHGTKGCFVIHSHQRYKAEYWSDERDQWRVLDVGARIPETVAFCDTQALAETVVESMNAGEEQA